MLILGSFHFENAEGVNNKSKRSWSSTGLQTRTKYIGCTSLISSSANTENKILVYIQNIDMIDLLVL